jgi:hypothetical protein
MAPSTITVSCTDAEAANELGTLAVVKEMAWVPEFAIVANAPVRSGTLGSLTYALLIVRALAEVVLVGVVELAEEHAVSASAAVARTTVKVRPRGRTKACGDMGLSSLSGQGWS